MLMFVIVVCEYVFPFLSSDYCKLIMCHWVKSKANWQEEKYIQCDFVNKREDKTWKFSHVVLLSSIFAHGDEIFPWVGDWDVSACFYFKFTDALIRTRGGS